MKPEVYHIYNAIWKQAEETYQLTKECKQWYTFVSLIYSTIGTVFVKSLPRNPSFVANCNHCLISCDYFC